MIKKIVFLIFSFFTLLNAQYNAKSLHNDLDTFFNTYVDAGFVKYQNITENPDLLRQIVINLQKFDIEKLSDPEHVKAFWINVYNILVIYSVFEEYPVSSPQDIHGFFDLNTHLVANEQLTINDIENTKLRDSFHDPRIHFVLVCAAKGCPKITKEVFDGKILEQQLDMLTTAALNNPEFIRVNPEQNTVYISEIFKWYKEDFLILHTDIRSYINQYMTKQIRPDYSLDYYTYDWSLNDSYEKENLDVTSINLQEYTPSTLLNPGQTEIKLFNNLYTQTAYFNQEAERTDLNQRSTYYTGIAYFLYGITNRINAGFDLYFKSVLIDQKSSSPFSIFNFSTSSNSRNAFTSIAPKIKVTPIPSISNLSIQTLVLIPLGKNFQSPLFLEYDAWQWWTQIFFDYTINDKFLIYLENGHYLRFSEDETAYLTPIKAIFNYYPSTRFTLYFTSELTPQWEDLKWSSYYVQAGIGLKYLVFSSLELELLYTKFLAGKNQGAGLTYNFGLRFLR
jgi:hypothetical protein